MFAVSSSRIRTLRRCTNNTSATSTPVIRLDSATPRTSAPCSATVCVMPPVKPICTAGCAACTRAASASSWLWSARSRSTSVARNAVRITITCVRPSALTNAERSSFAVALAQLVERRARRVVVEIDVERVRARDLLAERVARGREVGDRRVQHAVRADERAGGGVVALDVVDEVVIERRQLEDGRVGRRRARARLGRDDHHQHRVARGHALRQALEVHHRRRVRREQVGEVGAQRQVERDEVDRCRQEHDRARGDPGCVSFEPAHVARRAGHEAGSTQPACPGNRWQSRADVSTIRRYIDGVRWLIIILTLAMPVGVDARKLESRLARALKVEVKGGDTEVTLDIGSDRGLTKDWHIEQVTDSGTAIPDSACRIVRVAKQNLACISKQSPDRVNADNRFRLTPP